MYTCACSSALGSDSVPINRPNSNASGPTACRISSYLRARNNRGKLPLKTNHAVEFFFSVEFLTVLLTVFVAIVFFA